MFVLTTEKGKTFLKYFERKKLLEDEPWRRHERGLWVEVGHFRDDNIEYYLHANRALGFQVEIDENGTYRALVLKD